MSTLYIRPPQNCTSKKNLLINLAEVKTIWVTDIGWHIVKFRLYTGSGDPNVINIKFLSEREATEWFEKISNLVLTEV